MSTKKENLPSYIQKILSQCLPMAIVSIIIMLMARCVTLLQFQDSVKEEDIGQLFWYSMRWDLKLVSSLILINFILITPLLLLKKYKSALTVSGKINISFIVLICAVCFVHVLYWHSVGMPFDIFVFGLLEDETKAIINLFIDEYEPLKNFSLLTTIILICILIYQKTLHVIINKENPIGHKRKYFYIVTLFFALAILARGSLSLFPLNKKTTNFSSSMFMNDLAINAPNHLHYAWKEKNKDKFSKKTIEKRRKSGNSRLFSATQRLLYNGENTEHNVPLLFTSKADHGEKLPNIVFVMMESWSSHIFLSDSKENDLLGSFRDEIGKGALFTNFLSTRLGTNRFIESTLLNTSILDISISSAKNHHFKYSNLAPFIAQGYEIAFVSGGSQTWLNHGNFWKKQGVSYYWDMSDIISKYNINKHSDWGVHDEFTYRFAEEKLSELTKNGKPVFMFIITTSNHPPHTIPTQYKTPIYDVDRFKKYLIQPENAQQQLSTFRYSTDKLGVFLKNISKSSLNDRTIKIATGDHVMRGFFQFSNPKDKLFAGAVPLYIQVPSQYMRNKKWDTRYTASHRDVFPTLFELALPGAQYLKTGFNLLDDSEPKAAWHEHDIWMIDGTVNFSDPHISFEFDNELKITRQVSTTEKMRLYQEHIQSLEFLLEWQVINEVFCTDQVKGDGLCRDIPN